MHHVGSFVWCMILKSVLGLNDLLRDKPLYCEKFTSLIYCVCNFVTSFSFNICVNEINGSLLQTLCGLVWLRHGSRCSKPCYFQRTELSLQAPRTWCFIRFLYKYSPCSQSGLRRCTVACSVCGTAPEARLTDTHVTILQSDTCHY